MFSSAVPGPVAIVCRNERFEALAGALRPHGIPVEHAGHHAPARADVLAWLIAPDSLAAPDAQALARELEAGSCRRPVILAVDYRPGEGLATFLESGVCHVAAIGSEGPMLLTDFRQTLAQIEAASGARLSSYLKHPYVHEKHRVVRSADKGSVIASVAALSRRRRIADRLAQTLMTVADELITNALYNAPVDAAGAPRFASLGRGERVELAPHEIIEVTLAADDERFGIVVSDPFGSLAPARLGQSLARALKVRRVERHSGGAGLGMSWVLDAVTHLIVSVAPARRTSVMALVETQLTHRELARLPRSFDCFVEVGA